MWFCFLIAHVLTDLFQSRYRLFRPATLIGSEQQAVKKDGKRVGSRTLPFTRFASDWSDDISVQVNSMVLTDNAVFAAGPPDVEDEEESVKTLFDAQTQKMLAEQSAEFEGQARRAAGGGIS